MRLPEFVATFLSERFGVRAVALQVLIVDPDYHHVEFLEYCVPV